MTDTDAVGWSTTCEDTPTDADARLVAGDALSKVVASMGDNGEDRPGQRDMCDAVATAINTGRHLVVAAGTGTGKSMGYLAPVVTSGRTAVVATATKALQDQLIKKDLPKLAAALGRDIRFAVLKGRSNYVCAQKLVERQHAARSEQGELIAADDAGEADRIRGEIDRIADWAADTVDGDRAGLLFEPSHQAWEKVSTSGRECPGAKECPSGDVCFAEHAKAAADNADVVVVNTHLYCLNVFTPEAPILPDHDVAVFDEAHTIEDIAASAAGVQLTAGRFAAAARSVKAAVPQSKSVEALDAAGKVLAEALRPYRDELLPELPERIADAAVLCRGRLDDAVAELRNGDGNEMRFKLRPPYGCCSHRRSRSRGRFGEG